MEKLSPREQIALCVIVGNEPKRLDRALTMFGPSVSEMVVVHATGMEAKSVMVAEVCQKHGAIYDVYNNEPEHEWPHIDNFAAARQKSFDLATKEWALWIDADDTPGPDFAAALHELLDKFPEMDGFCLYHDVAGRGIAHNLRERLLRRTKFQWRNRIHENCYAIDEKSVKLAKCDQPVVLHLPDDEPKQGPDRNLRILESIPEAERTTSDLYHLGGEYQTAGRKEEAIALFREAIKRPDCAATERYELCLNIAELARPPIIETESHEYRVMSSALHHGFSLQPWRREALALLGALHLDIGDPERSEAYLRTMLALPTPSTLPWTHRASLYGWAGESLWTQFLRLSGKIEQADGIEAARLKTHKYTISIIHPTRGRPEQAAAVRKQWLENAANAERIEHIFGLELDNPDLEILGRFRHATVPAGLMDSPGGNCVKAYNAAARAAKGDIIIACADDFAAPPLHWDNIVESELRQYVDTYQPAMLQIRDGYRTDDLVVTPCVTRKTLKVLDYGGGIYSDEYVSMFCDTELTARAAAGGWLVPSSMVIKHEHPTHRPDLPVHPTTARSNKVENYKNGFETFKRRNPDYCKANPAFEEEFRALLGSQ
jgi:glycosyltransferase involved in cell wall biosynthesis